MFHLYLAEIFAAKLHHDFERLMFLFVSQCVCFIIISLSQVSLG